jgi:hypothetical protein
MTRPAQKWIGVGTIAMAFLVTLFTLAVPYVNHFGEGQKMYTYYTKWSGRWRSDLLPPGTFAGADSLYNFPTAAPVFIGIGILIMIAGAFYLFWLTYSNKACYFTREKPGPVGGATMVIGSIFYLIGNLIYESWAFGSPRPLEGWPGDNQFVSTTVRISPTFWVGIVIGIIALALGTMSVIYYLDTVEKRPVK